MLQFQAQAHISEIYHLGLRDTTTRIVYVELCGHNKNYGVVKDDGFFEIFCKFDFVLLLCISIFLLFLFYVLNAGSTLLCSEGNKMASVW